MTLSPSDYQMTDQQELDALIERARCAGYEVTVRYDKLALATEGRTLIETVRIRGAGVGPSPMPPISAAERLRELDAHGMLADRLFIGVMGGGVSFADRGGTKHGDYARLGLLTFDRLNLDVESDCPPFLRVRIERFAAEMRARAGEPEQVSSSGQSTTLGYALSPEQQAELRDSAHADLGSV